jgi:hypothetical protein
MTSAARPAALFGGPTVKGVEAQKAHNPSSIAHHARPLTHSPPPHPPPHTAPHTAHRTTPTTPLPHAAPLPAQVILNGRRYASATPKQFCLFPPQAISPLLLRSVGPGIPAALGPVFWLNDTIAPEFVEASKREGVVALSDMDAQTKADIKLLGDHSHLPCDTTATAAGGQTTKCEACKNGCDYPLPAPPAGNAAPPRSGGPGHGGWGVGGGGEYTHYNVPNSTAEVIIHRTKDHELGFTWRGDPADGVTWEAQRPTTIKDADSNINAGVLPDGRIFLASNACTKGRDPLVVSTSADGYHFTGAVAVMSCKTLDGQCSPRYAGASKHGGQAYPQAVAVTGPSKMAGLWIAATNNKEDVWVAKVAFTALE